MTLAYPQKKWEALQKGHFHITYLMTFHKGQWIFASANCNRILKGGGDSPNHSWCSLRFQKIFPNGILRVPQLPHPLGSPRCAWRCFRHWYLHNRLRVQHKPEWLTDRPDILQGSPLKKPPKNRVGWWNWTPEGLGISYITYIYIYISLLKKGGAKDWCRWFYRFQAYCLGCATCTSSHGWQVV